MYEPASDASLLRLGVYVLEPAQIGQIEAEWATAPGADPTRAILYIHGGGYISGSLLSHRGLATEAGRAAGARVLTLAYRRAPEDPFPAAVEDVVDAYRFMLDQGLSPNRIAIAGDSAGGGLTMALLIAARDRGLPLPACGWCISPWVDMEAHGQSFVAKATINTMIRRK